MPTQHPATPPPSEGAPDPTVPPLSPEAAAAAEEALAAPTPAPPLTPAQRLLGTLQAARQQGDKTLIIAGVVVLALVLGVVAVAVLNRRQQSQPQQMVYTPQFDVGMSSQEEIRSFTSKTSKEVTEIQGEVGELTKSMAGLLKRQDETEGFVKETMRQAAEAFAKEGSAKVQEMEAYAHAAQGPTDPRTGAIVDQFRQALTSLKESPAEAKARAALMLRQAGVSEDRIRNLLAQAAEQAGRLSVGDIAEAPASPAEIASLPPWARNLVPALRDTLYAIGIADGRFYPGQVLPDVKVFLRAHVRARALVTDPVVAAMAQVCRIRRENLPTELQDVLPFLVTLRDSRHLDRGDQNGIAHLVWAAKDRYPGTTTAGQLLSLCDVVARAVGAVAPATGSAPGFIPLDDQATTFATAAVGAAVWQAIQLGKTDAEQYAIADRALGNYLDTTRAIATPEQRRTIVLAGMNQAQARRTPALAAPPPTAAPHPAAEPARAAAPSAPVGDAGDQALFFGPIRVTRAAVQRAVVYTLPGLMAVNGIRPEGAPGAAALVCGIEQVPRLVGAELGPCLGRPMGGRDFLQSVLPQAITAMHMGQALGKIPVPVSPGHADETSPEAQLVRGAAIGAIYGPLVHDDAKAKAVAPDAIASLEQAPPLTRGAHDRLAQTALDQPYARIITALDIVRPAQFGYPPERYQAMVEALAQLVAFAQQERASVAALFATSQEGVFDENIRMLIPLALASHDDGQTPVADVAALVRTDIGTYTVLFLAESRLSHQVLEDVIPRYAPAMGEEAGGGAALVQAAVTAVPAVLEELFHARAPTVTPDALAECVSSLVEAGAPRVELLLVAQVVLGRVLPRLQHAGALSDATSTAAALAHARAQAQTLVAPPYTPVRIDGWANQLTQEGMALLQGAPAPAGGAPRGARGGIGGWSPVVMLPCVAGQGPLVGTTSTLVATRQIVIPANTYGNAHIQTGVDAEVGGRANVPVMLQIDFDWVGPANSRLVMRGCRLSGVANAMAGPERVAIDLKTLSFVFPSGRELDAEVHGYVSDNIHGEYGALGTYQWNAEKVLPLASIAGGFKGAADALKANTTTTIVGAAGTTAVSANQGSQLRTAAFGGVAGGFGIMSDYVQSVLQAVHPSVSVVNGQRLSVVLLDPVVLTVPEEEFDALAHAAPGSFAP